MSIFLKITSAVWIGGEIAKPGNIVEVSDLEAKDLLGREVAVLANAEDAPKVAPKAGPISVGDSDEDEGEAAEPSKKRRGK